MLAMGTKTKCVFPITNQNITTVQRARGKPSPDLLIFMQVPGGLSVIRMILNGQKKLLSLAKYSFTHQILIEQMLCTGNWLKP